MRPNKGRVEFECDDLLLERGFYWAKAMALSYAHENAPVGDWYEAALPGRDAFCMRDVAHSALGAQVLGLASHNKNMLRQFALGMSESRKYCGYWEITSKGLPLGNDYTSDTDFWYNLPANFDVLQACWRMFCWTNDHDYLHLPEMNAFYNATVTDYIRAWDEDGDGIPERKTPGSRMGIPSYEERDEYADAKVMSDLLALQALAFDAYARIHRMKGNDYLYDEYTQKADALRLSFDQEWWHAPSGRFGTVRRKDGTLVAPSESGEDLGILPLYYGLIADRQKRREQLESLRDCESAFVEYLTYLPELFYRGGLMEDAYQNLLRLTHPHLARRDYPEIGFAVVGAIAEGIMGVQPQAERVRIVTEARLPKAVTTARMARLPVFGGEVDVSNDHNRKLSLINNTGADVQWQPVFAGTLPALLLNGEPQSAQHGETPDGQPYTYAVLTIANGHTATAQTTQQE